MHVTGHIAGVIKGDPPYISAGICYVHLSHQRHISFGAVRVVTLEASTAPAGIAEYRAAATTVGWTRRPDEVRLLADSSRTIIFIGEINDVSWICDGKHSVLIVIRICCQTAVGISNSGKA